MVCIPSSSGSHFARTLAKDYDPSVLGVPAYMAHSFIELCKPLCHDKAVICEGLIKVCIVKAMVFPVVTYGCESWNIKKAECQRIDAFVLRCWRRLLKVPWTARRLNQSILREINPEYSLEELMLKLQYSGYLMRIADSMEKSLMPGKTEGRRRRGYQGMR